MNAGDGKGVRTAAGMESSFLLVIKDFMHIV